MNFIGNLLEKIFHTRELGELQSLTVELKRKVKELEMELEERDKLLDVTRKEYDTLKSSLKEEIKQAKSEEILDVFTEISSPLSQLNTMKRMEQEGKDIKIKDVLRLVNHMEKIFSKKGLSQTCSAGEKVIYDSTVHQLSGNFSPKEKEEVLVRFCGYKINDKLIKRALVSSGE